jgi:nucleotide-binding universal stress UspA family protein
MCRLSASRPYLAETRGVRLRGRPCGRYMKPPIGSNDCAGHASSVAMKVVSGPVVCGIGGREAGHRVATVAAELAKALGARLIAVRAEAIVKPHGSRTAALRRGHAWLQDMLSEAEPDYQGVTRTVKLGDSATALAAVAAQERAQLLVVGAGRGTAPAAPLGPVPRELSMRASCPVVVLPRTPASTRMHRWLPRHVLCAFDGSDDARATLSVAAAIAERLGTATFVAHVNPASVGELEARAQAERAGLIVAPSYPSEDWHPTPPGSAPARWPMSGSIPLMLVPPTYGSRNTAYR